MEYELVSIIASWSQPESFTALAASRVLDCSAHYTMMLEVPVGKDPRYRYQSWQVISIRVLLLWVTSGSLTV
jgi:hypothetical protein